MLTPIGNANHGHPWHPLKTGTRKQLGDGAEWGVPFAEKLSRRILRKRWQGAHLCYYDRLTSSFSSSQGRDRLTQQKIWKSCTMPLQGCANMPRLWLHVSWVCTPLEHVGCIMTQRAAFVGNCHFSCTRQPQTCSLSGQLCTEHPFCVAWRPSDARIQPFQADTDQV